MGGITERISRTTDLTDWKGEIPLEFVYTMGRAGERFFRTIMEQGKLIGARCEQCKILYVPPRIYCEACLGRLEDHYVGVSHTGMVHTFTLCYESMDGRRYKEPHILALVKLDGTDGGLVHYLGEVEPGDVYIGMPVEAVFKPREERKGSILDIRYFRPIGK
jgi:uncharacterized OB-fold protein